MKLKSLMYKKVKTQLESMGFYKVTFDNSLYNFKPSGELLTEQLDRGFFKTELNADDSKLKITFQMLALEPVIITLSK